MLECDNVNVTGLLVVYFVGNSLYINVFLLLYKKIFVKEREVWQKGFSNKIIVTLVTQGLLSSSSPVLLCKFTNNKTKVRSPYQHLLASMGCGL